MRKTGLAMAVVLAVLVGMTADALCEEGAAENGAVAPGARPGMPARRLGQDGGRGNRRMQHFGFQQAAMQWLKDTEESKAEIERFQKVLETLKAEQKTIHDAIRADIQGGKKPQEAFAAHAEEIRALAKKGLLAVIEHRQKMLEIAKLHIDEFLKKQQELMQKRFADRAANRGPRPGKAGDQDQAEP